MRQKKLDDLGGDIDKCVDNKNKIINDAIIEQGDLNNQINALKNIYKKRN